MDIAQLKQVDGDINEGHWIDDIPNLPGVRLKVRSSRAPLVVRKMAKMYREKAGPDGNVPDDIQDAIEFDITAENILLDWEGIEDGGKPVPFSVDQAREWLQISIFDEGVRYAVSRASLLSQERLDGLVKNLPKRSARSSKAA